jgi:hypothetical protein
MIDIETPEGMLEAKQWMVAFLSLLSNNCVWGVPRSSAVYNIDKKHHIVTAKTSARDESMERVFEAIGYKVV